MITIGLTGGIATGKSTVSGILRQRGARIIDADHLAREVVEPGQPAWEKIVAHFGPDILLPDKTIDRKRLGKIVFADAEARLALNNFTHPAVISRTQEILDGWRDEPGVLAVVDAPLLLEAGMESLVEEVWVVATDAKTQIRRLMQRDNLTPEEAQQRLAAQMPLAEKIRRATRVIDNNGTRDATRRQVEAYLQHIQERLQPR
ncbi:MAG: dephospho-CoA kinase [Clostridia bacterium]|nr:MAG: dephospho-CoA kinase [Clostridia bacterium]